MSGRAPSVSGAENGMRERDDSYTAPDIAGMFVVSP